MVFNRRLQGSTSPGNTPQEPVQSDYEVTSPRPLKALFFSHNLELEGAPLYLYDVVKGLKRNRVVEPVVVSPRRGPLKGCF